MPKKVDSEKRYNVQYFNEDGFRILYLQNNCDLATATRWCNSFNERYRKPYPNGKGYYAAAKVVQVSEEVE